MSAPYETTAIVLRKRTLLRKDILVTLFTRDLGKITAIAKGARSFTSRRASHLQSGNYVTVEISSSGEYSYIRSSSVISAFSQLKSYDAKVAGMYRILYVLDRILPEKEPEPQAFQAALSGLIRLSSADTFIEQSQTDLVRRLLMVLGYTSSDITGEEAERLFEEIIGEKLPERVII